jgi:hypothetical protein
MNVLRVILPLAVAAAVAAPSALAGNSAPPPLPSAVNVPLVGATAALNKALNVEALGKSDRTVAALSATRSFMRQAWSGLKYVIDHSSSTTSMRRIAVSGANAHARGNTPPVADQYTTALAVLTLLHTVETTAMGMVDTAAGPVLSGVSSTIFAALNTRDAANAYIYAVNVTGTPPWRRRKRKPRWLAHAAGQPTWGNTMPAVAPMVADELAQIDELLATAQLSPGKTRVVKAAELQDLLAAQTLAADWPPVS